MTVLSYYIDKKNNKRIIETGYIYQARQKELQVNAYTNRNNRILNIILNTPTQHFIIWPLECTMSIKLIFRKQGLKLGTQLQFKRDLQ
jgi:hypothetical protein